MEWSHNRLSIAFLGGLGEVGKNIMALSYGPDILVVDCGLTFPDDNMPGVDIVIPDLSYLVQHGDRVRGIALTHGHEDHVGALGYLLPHLPRVPVYGSRLTLGLVAGRFRELCPDLDADFRPVSAAEEATVGPFKVGFFRVNHSVPDAFGLGIETPVGTVLHTGDFKFDQTPVDGEVTDYHRLAEYGHQGVLVMLADSTHADRPGYTPSEKVVGQEIDRILSQAPGRVIVTTFASNVHRIQEVMTAADRRGRKVGVIGRSMLNTIDVASRLGYLNIPPGTVVGLEEALRTRDRQCVLLASGSQGEPMSALTRIARHEHPRVEIKPHDTVILAATPVPGNERTVARTVDDLYREGATVVRPPYHQVHVSGHGSEEELKMMINLIKPQYFVPIHGEYRNLVRHGQLATQLGVAEDHVFVVENGTVLEFSAYHGRISGKVASGAVYVDGRGVGDVGSAVIRERTQLSQDGVLVVAVTVDLGRGRILAGPDVVTRGFVYVRESEALLTEIKATLTRALRELEGNPMDWPLLKGVIRDRALEVVELRTGRKPTILPVIMECEPAGS